MTRRRIAIAGFQHETNTFAPGSTGMAEFRMADSWPELLCGRDVIKQTRWMNLPIAGAVTAAEANGEIELIPILWCAAEPGGPVTDEAFDRISGMILDGLAKAGPLSAIYLDLHGAMVTESFDDGEGELLSRIRRKTGPSLPIGVSLDLHANISAHLVEQASVITIYRTYPHLDMARTGARCVDQLLEILNGRERKAAFRQVPFLVPLHAQNTGAEPCRTLYHLLDRLPSSQDEFIDLAMGFTASDISDCGPSLVAYATTHERAEVLADTLFDRICASEGAFDTKLLTATEAVQAAKTMAGTGPVIIADVQDNAGAGGSSDTTGLLRALIDCEADGALLGVMRDARIAAMAHEAGPGAVIQGGLGGKSGLEQDAPFEGRFRVLSLSEGHIVYTGEMYGGGIAEVGPSCLLSVEDVAGDIQIVVSSERTQCLDRAFFTHFGREPAKCSIVCVKSTVHFRADFEPGSRAVLNAAAPGWFSCQLENLPYGKLRNGLRLARISKD